jgi:hypothetical protein
MLDGSSVQRLCGRGISAQLNTCQTLLPQSLAELDSLAATSPAGTALAPPSCWATPPGRPASAGVQPLPATPTPTSAAMTKPGTPQGSPCIPPVTPRDAPSVTLARLPPHRGDRPAAERRASRGATPAAGAATKLTPQPCPGFSASSTSASWSRRLATSQAARASPSRSHSPQWLAFV